MKRINLYLIAVLFIPFVLWKLNNHLTQEVVSFYGFAENKETEINFNYPVAIGDIKVRPGEQVAANTPLVTIYRIKSKEILGDESFKIAELTSKERIWRTEKENEQKELAGKQKLAIEKLQTEKERIIRKAEQHRALLKDLKTVKDTFSTDHSLTQKIANIDREIALLEANFASQKESIQQELSINKNPFQIERERLKAVQQFQSSTQKQQFELTAPFNGLIGNIHCKEGEHVPSYKTLITFYEPNPTLVKGFVQEDLIVHVAAKDSFIVRSTNQAETFCYGEVIGLGSRIVEIPERLRKSLDVKTYGREVLVAIPSNNPFLQKEKVILEFIETPERIASYKTAKPLKDLQEGKLTK